MADLQPGDKAPAFNMVTDGSGRISLKNLKGQSVILYFYPKDDTPGCTTESCAFRDNLKALTKLKATVVGVSKDGPESHDKFKAKYELNFPLASDEDGSVCEAYGVWKEKSNYGKTYMGIERSTFLIDDKGVIREIWRKVKVDGHAEEVMDALGALRKAA